MREIEFRLIKICDDGTKKIVGYEKHMPGSIVLPLEKKGLERSFGIYHGKEPNELGKYAIPSWMLPENWTGPDMFCWINCDIKNQYTGKKDKHGTKGYDKDFWSDGYNVYQVEWNEGKAGFELVREKDGRLEMVYSMAHFPEGEIVGNVVEGIKKKRVEK